MDQEPAAIALLTRAVELDIKKRYTESLLCYQEGLHLFMEVIKVIKDDQRKAAFRKKASEYMDRAEKLRDYIESEKKRGKFHEQRKINFESIGNSYESLFGRFLNSEVSRVVIEDPYIRSHHQIMNFLRLCELLVKKCTGLKLISLKTSYDEQNKEEQITKLNLLKQELMTNNIKLQIEYSPSLHDREIRFNNGWIVKIGRGLDIYKAPNKMSLGYFDLDLRQCLETTVDIFHSKEITN